MRRSGAGQGGAEGAGGEEGGGDSDGVVSTAVLEGENRDLIARMKNELDDARLVETKMSEVIRTADRRATQSAFESLLQAARPHLLRELIVFATSFASSLALAFL